VEIVPSLRPGADRGRGDYPPRRRAPRRVCASTFDPWRVADPFNRYPTLGAPPFPVLEGWATTLLGPTPFILFGQSFTFTTPASAQAYHRKLLQAHSSGALTNPRVTGNCHFGPAIQGFEPTITDTAPGLGIYICQSKGNRIGGWPTWTRNSFAKEETCRST
jgi:hypothetical protein